MDTTNPITATKRQLREAMRARRAALPLADRDAGAKAIAAHGIGWLVPPPPRGAIVSGFLSIGEEFDTAPLLAALSTAGFRLCLPVMQGRDGSLLFRAWTPGDNLATVQWGIREPTPDQPALTPDILLVPLLAFDRRGNRLGYGGGYYDRTIGALRNAKPIVAIGLAFDNQEVDAVPHLDYDQPLDWVLTPSGPRRCLS